MSNAGGKITRAIVPPETKLIDHDQRLKLMERLRINVEMAMGPEGPMGTTGPRGLPGPAGAPGPPAVRETTEFSTATLATDASATVNLTLAKAADVYRIATNRPARVRAYGTAAKRAADSSRPVNVPPVTNPGLQLEVVTAVDLLTIDMGPIATLVNLDDPAEETIYFTVQNTDTVAGIVTVTLLSKDNE